MARFMVHSLNVGVNHLAVNLTECVHMIIQKVHGFARPGELSTTYLKSCPCDIIWSRKRMNKRNLFTLHIQATDLAQIIAPNKTDKKSDRHRRKIAYLIFWLHFRIIFPHFPSPPMGRGSPCTRIYAAKVHV